MTTQSASSRVRFKPVHSHPDHTFPSIMLPPELQWRILLVFGGLLHYLAALMQILAKAPGACERLHGTHSVSMPWLMDPNRTSGMVSVKITFVFQVHTLSFSPSLSLWCFLSLYLFNQIFPPPSSVVWWEAWSWTLIVLELYINFKVLSPDQQH